MTPSPTLSLITPTRNQADFLPRTIASVLGQSVAPREWIILDAMSTDATPDILRSQAGAAWIRVVREPDRGQSDAINKGLRLATGTHVGWLNSDDELLPGALERVLAALELDPEVVLVYGAGHKIGLHGELLKRVPARPFDPREARTAFRILQPAMFFHRETALRLGGLQESLHYAMDWELVLRLAAVGRVRVIAEELAALRVYPNTKSETGGWARLAEIARIGRARHGWTDANHLCYVVRRAVWRTGSPFLRRVADFVLGRIYRPGTVMVTGWPSA